MKILANSIVADNMQASGDLTKRHKRQIDFFFKTGKHF